MSASAPSILLHNGLIYSDGASGAPGPTALLIDDGSISWVGSRREDAPHRADRLVDLDGRWVAPAFVDSHVHATGTGQSILGLDLTAARSKSEALRMVAAYCHGHDDVVLGGHGWDETTWPENAPPTLVELDEACGGRALYLTRVDAHSGLVSSRLRAEVPGVHGALGEPESPDSAHLRLEAYALVHQYAGRQITAVQRRAAQRATLQRCAELGIGLVVEMAGPTISSESDLTALLELAEAPDTIDVAAYWGELERVDIVQELGLSGAGGDLFCDGALGSHSAAISAPYADDPGRGHLWISREQVAAHVRACTAAGVQAGFHAIGDAAVGTVIDGIGDVADEVGEAAMRRLAHRVEHCEMVTAGQIATMSRLGVVASVQPMFDRLWGGTGSMYYQRLGPRAGMLNPFASLAGAGVPLAFGSDSPVTPLDPWETVRAAVAHHRPGQRISARSAFAAATAGGWRALRRERAAGTLRAGAPAYLAAWEPGDAVPPIMASGRHRHETVRPACGDSAEGGEWTAPACALTIAAGRVVHDTGLLGN